MYPEVWKYVHIFFKSIYCPVTEIVVVAEAFILSLSTAIVMQWFSVSRALHTADISGVL
jgi:hypothetical protein